MLAATGSTATTATSSPRSAKIARTASRSLYGAVSVSFALPSVTPGDDGIPRVASPLPAPLARSESECPW